MQEEGGGERERRCGDCVGYKYVFTFGNLTSPPNDVEFTSGKRSVFLYFL